MLPPSLVEVLRQLSQDCFEMGLTVGTKVVGRSCYEHAATLAEPYEWERLALIAENARLKDNIDKANSIIKELLTLCEECLEEDDCLVVSRPMLNMVKRLKP